jgi:hypothetical protein
MIVGIQATRSFSDYAVFLRGISVALSDMKDEDKNIVIYSAGPVNLNSMAMEFCNKTEDSLKARGIKIRMNKIPASWLKDNIMDMDYFAYFSVPKEAVSTLVREAEDHDIEVGIFRY